MPLEREPLAQQSVNWDEYPFIPRLPQPHKIIPIIRKYRRKILIPLKDIPPLKEVA